MTEQVRFACFTALLAAAVLPAACGDGVVMEPANPNMGGQLAGAGVGNPTGAGMAGMPTGGGMGPDPAGGGGMAGTLPVMGGMMPMAGAPAGMGNAGMGNAGMGNAGMGNAGMGNAGMGMGGECAAAGATNSGQNPTPTFETVKAIMDYGCYGAQCHDLEEHPLFLKGTDEEILEELKTHTVAKCGGALVVDVAAPGNSAFIRAMRGECEETPRMPPTCMQCDSSLNNNSCIPDDYIDAVEAWIASGAMP